MKLFRDIAAFEEQGRRFVLATVIAPPLLKALASSRSAEWVMSMAPPLDSTDDKTDGVAADR